MISGLDRRSLGKVGDPKVATNKVKLKISGSYSMSDLGG